MVPRSEISRTSFSSSNLPLLSSTYSSSKERSKWSSIVRLPRPVMIRMSSSPARIASSTTYWIAGLSTIGSISLGWALVAGRNLVPSPAAGMTAFLTFIASTPLGGVAVYSPPPTGSSPRDGARRTSATLWPCPPMSTRAPSAGSTWRSSSASRKRRSRSAAVAGGRCARCSTRRASCSRARAFTQPTTVPRNVRASPPRTPPPPRRPPSPPRPAAERRLPQAEGRAAERRDRGVRRLRVLLLPRGDRDRSRRDSLRQALRRSGGRRGRGPQGRVHPPTRSQARVPTAQDPVPGQPVGDAGARRHAYPRAERLRLAAAAREARRLRRVRPARGPHTPPPEHL